QEKPSSTKYAADRNLDGNGMGDGSNQFGPPLAVACRRLAAYPATAERPIQRACRLLADRG
ncbi:MAG: hypothetical protein ACK559_12865, partial [bacterium]